MRAFLAFLAFGAICGAAGLTPDERQANIDSFEHVWKTVQDRHWETRPGGLDWKAVHDELRPKIDKAKDNDEARQIIRSMLGRLHQTHFGIYPADVYKEFESPGSAEGQVGIELRPIDGRAIVTRVEDYSPAEVKGVKPGWEILRVDGHEIRPTLERVSKNLSDSTLHDLQLTRSVESRLEGPVDKAVDVDFLDAGDRKIALKLDRTVPRGKLEKLGSLPAFYVWIESKRVRPDIAYVEFNAFFDPDAISRTFADAVKSCPGCSGFVIDLRGNPGGLGALAMGVGGWFIDKSGLQLGTMILRESKLNFVVFPRPEPFRGPLAILVDGCSASTSEIFSGGMQDLHRARVFGTRTAGAALPSVFERLANGDGFQFAIANYISEGGKPLEGVGVTPDEEVRLTRRELLAGKDPVLDAAIRWIETQK